MQRIIELELDQAAKVQENRLLMMKYKNFEGGRGSVASHQTLNLDRLGGLSNRQLNLGSIDGPYRSPAGVAEGKTKSKRSMRTGR